MNPSCPKLAFDIFLLLDMWLAKADRAVSAQVFYQFSISRPVHAELRAVCGI
jgi:hypothetical protein